MVRRQETNGLRRPHTRDRDEGLREDTARTPSPSHETGTPSSRRRVGKGNPMTRMRRKTSQALQENRIIVVNTRPTNEFSNGGTNAEEDRDHSALVTNAANETGVQDEGKSNKCGNKKGELRRLTALVEGVVKDASTEQVLEYTKKGAKRDLTEIITLRAKLDRADAAVEVGKLEHSVVVADLQEKLLEREQTLHRLEEESLQQGIQRKKSKAEETKLKDELKRTQDALSFLSAWDEEKVELEAEVKSLKMKVFAAFAEGKERLEEARREFHIASMTEALIAQKQLASDRLEIRQDLERELNDEFRDRRRENDEFRQEIEHQNQEMNDMMKELTRAKGALCTKRAELEDERRMHLLTIRGKKLAEALIAKLQAQLTGVNCSKPCCPQQPRFSARPGVRSELDTPRDHRNATRNGSAAPHTGNSACVVGPQQAGGSVRADVGHDVAFDRCQATTLLSRATHDGTRGSNSRSSRTGCADLGNMVELLVPASSGGASTQGDGETTAAAHGIGGAYIPAGSKHQRSSAGAAGGDGICSGKDIINDTFSTVTSGNKVPDIDTTSSVIATPGSNNGRKGRKEGEFFEMLPYNASEVTSADVWSQLDSYIHRRSEVARTNRHIRVIEALHKSPMKPIGRAANAAENSSTSSTFVKHVDKEARVRRHSDCYTTVNDEVVWRASHERLDRQQGDFDIALSKRLYCRVNKRSADGSRMRGHVHGDSSDPTERASGSIALSTMSKRTRRRGLYPPRGVRNASQFDGSVSTFSHGRALCDLGTLYEGEQDRDHIAYTAGTTSMAMIHPKDIEEEGTDRKEFGTMARPPDDIIESTGPRSGEQRGPVGITVVQKPHQSGWHRCIDRKGCLHSDDDGSAGPDLGESALPSLTSNTRSATRITKDTPCARTAVGPLKDAGGEWGDRTIKRMLPLGKPRGDGEGRGNLSPRGSGWRMGGGNKGGGLDAKRRTCRKIELAEWIQANTNLVNVPPWENSGSSSPPDIPGAAVFPVKSKLPCFPPITY